MKEKILKVFGISLATLLILFISFAYGYKAGYKKEFYSIKIVENTCNDKVKIKTIVYDRQWRENFLKTTICDKENKRKTLRQLGRECRVLIKTGELRNKAKKWYPDNKKQTPVNPPQFRQISK